MKKSTPFIAGITTVMVASMITGCGESSSIPANSSSANSGVATSDSKQILHMNNTEEPGSLHPAKAQGSYDSWIIEHIFEGLMKKDPSGRSVPGIAKDVPDISPDGKTYTIRLRHDAKWSNGDPVTAQDFEKEWKYVLDPATASEYAYQLYYIKGAKAYNESKEIDPAKLKALTDAVGVKAKDDHTLVVELEQPTPYFTDLLSFYTYFPVDSKVQEQNPNWAKEAVTLVSNGPFKMKEWKHKDHVTIVKNNQYYDKDRIKLQEIDWAMVADENTAYQMYKSNQLDLIYPIPTAVIPSLKQSKSTELHIAPDLSLYFYEFNTNKTPFNNLKVRKALSMAIDRKTIVENVTQGGQVPAFGIVPPGIIDADGKQFQSNSGDLFKENLDQAKKLLAEGLQEEGMTEMPGFGILYNTSDGHKKIAEVIQEMWRRNLGIEVTTKNVEFQVKIELGHQGDFDVLRSGWIGDYIDPMTFIEVFGSTSMYNNTGWKSADYDKLVIAAKETMDPDVRMENMHQAEKLLVQNMPIIPIYYYTKPFLVKPNVKGVYDIVNRSPQVQYVEMK